MGRELEVKLLADGATFEQAVDLVRLVSLREASSFSSGGVTDSYWRSLPSAKASFVRLRMTKEVELTSKVIDKGTITDRIEHNVRLHKDDGSVALELLESVLGPATHVLYRYVDFELDRGTSVSVIQNLERVEWCFIEVEGLAIEYVTEWVKKLQAAAEFQLHTVRNSFFDIFVERQGVKL